MIGGISSSTAYFGSSAEMRERPVGSDRSSDGSQARSAADSGRSDAQSTPTGEGRTGEAKGAPEKSANQQNEEQRAIQQLKARDREVRAHEAAHIAAGGGLVRGGASFSFERGPDGQLYAIGGEVSIDVSGGRTPQETIAKAARIRAAALAPADPSSQDVKVAAQAAQMAADAQRQLAAAYGQTGEKSGSRVSEFA